MEKGRKAKMENELELGFFFSKKENVKKKKKSSYKNTYVQALLKNHTPHIHTYILVSLTHHEYEYEYVNPSSPHRKSIHTIHTTQIIHIIS